ncbi:MAG: hypothetical protein ABSB31_08260 [Dehalococcoidia bacterium]
MTIPAGALTVALVPTETMGARAKLVTVATGGELAADIWTVGAGAVLVTVAVGALTVISTSNVPNPSKLVV